MAKKGLLDFGPRRWKTGVCQSGVRPSIGLLYMVGKVSLLAF